MYTTTDLVFLFDPLASYIIYITSEMHCGRAGANPLVTDVGRE